MSPKPSTIKALPIAELVEDMTLYPRHAVDDMHVVSLVAAMEAGSQLPAIVADRKSKRVTDGWHRMRAYRRFLGAEAVVDVELVSYRNEAEMLVDAIRRNATHGRRLDKIDLTRSILMLEARKVTKVQIAVVLNMTEDRVEKLRIRVATSSAADSSNVPGTRKIVLKRPVRHLRDTTLTKDQIEAHKMMPGTSFLLVARQLDRALRTKLVDLDDRNLVKALQSLREALGEAVG